MKSAALQKSNFNLIIYCITKKPIIVKNSGLLFAFVIKLHLIIRDAQCIHPKETE